MTFLATRVSLGAASTLAAAALLLPIIPAIQAEQAGADRFWGQWRGPHTTGVSKTATPPTEWSETRNIRWKVPIPGRSSSSPVVWNDRIFLLTSVDADPASGAGLAPRGSVPAPSPHKFVVMALDRKSGKTVWEQVVREETPHERHQENGTWASTSAVTDGEVVIASFESRGIYAFDLNGKKLWEKDLGNKRMRSQFGEGSTPALHDKYLVHVWDHQGESFIVALDKSTGNALWRQPRKEIDTWATPLITTVNGKAQVVVPAMNQIQAYDLETGAQHYGLQRLEAAPNVFASPVGAAGRVYITGRDGATVVLRHGPKFEVLATNTLDDGFDSSAALVDGELYLKGYRYLYSIAEG